VPAPIRYHAHGKINLYLDVLDRRPDGFTNIETIFQSLSPHDTLTFTPRSDGAIVVTCDQPAVGPPEQNLAHRAAALLREHAGLPHGVNIHIEKRLPIAGGMAGGSVDGAAALAACNTLWDAGLDAPALHRLAERLGSDVPYCLRGGTVAATGRGEELRPLPPLREACFVLVHPPLAISAGHVYTHPALTRGTPRPGSGGTTPAFARALDRLAVGDVAGLVFNRMESAVFTEYPALAGIRDALLGAGCPAAALSGSGPTLFGLCTGPEHARDVAARLAPHTVRIADAVGTALERVE
jgi:4-diphosphocytidyl-2-C-methyl-D-erythritol kinase